MSFFDPKNKLSPVEQDQLIKLIRKAGYFERKRKKGKRTEHSKRV